jgi:LysR family transcriptional regulator, cell division regulator
VFEIGCSYRQRLESVLADLRIIVAKPMEFGSLDIVISCVAAGVGVTLLPRSMVVTAQKDGKVSTHGLPPKYAKTETLFVHRNDAYLSSAMKAFLHAARSQA